MQNLPLEPTQPASRLPYDDYLPLIPPPPPPPPRSRRWRLAALVVCAVLVLAVSTTTAFLLGMQQGRDTRNSSMPTPTLAPTPTPAAGIASPDRYVFAQALGDALLQKDTVSILPAVATTQFIIGCSSTVSGTDGDCYYTSWSDLQGEISTGGVGIDLLSQGLDLVEGTASLGSYCSGPVSIGGSFLLVGTFARDIPLPHTGLAVLAISKAGPGSVTTWVWSAVYFC